MAKSNKANNANKEKKVEEKLVKIKIVYPAFKNKYTKKMYDLNEVIEVTEKRLEEIKDCESKNKVKLFEVIEDEKTVTSNEENNEGENNA